MYYFIIYISCAPTVACPTNVVISNGNAQISEDGRSVTYQCADNFKLVGAAAAECKQDGTWTSPPPKCIGMYATVYTQFIIF